MNQYIRSRSLTAVHFRPSLSGRRRYPPKELHGPCSPQIVLGHQGGEAVRFAARGSEMCGESSDYENGLVHEHGLGYTWMH